jgi:tRNA A-37 threonylcarbamoyl transferase component Bud32/predicted GH43/DUF377 family glycosyl hydrolase
VHPVYVVKSLGEHDPGPSESLTIGSRAGAWVIEGELGRGGMGVVYAVRHEKIGKRAALKIVQRHLHDAREIAERLLREAQVVNAIGHPNIVDIFDVGTTPDGRSYFVMELLSGHSLAEVEVSLDNAFVVLLQVCDALISAHAMGVVHRDIKPGNIFLVDDDPAKVKLLDWGIARVVHIESKVTYDGQLVGTPRYVSPEQARGEPVTAQSDVYSLGVVAYEVLVGHAPFEAESPTEELAMHLYLQPPPARERWPAIPVRLERLLQNMLAKRPEGRPRLANVAAELREMRRLMHMDPVAPPPQATFVEEEEEQEEEPPRRRAWLPAIGGVLLAFAVLVAIATHETARLEALHVSPARPVAIAPAPPPAPLSNPVLEDCADPSILRDGERSYMTCTGRSGGNIYPIYESRDLQTWQRVGWIFPDGTRPAWADGNYWAPELHRVGGEYVAYFSMRERGGRNAIGVATSATPTGPYRAQETPLVASPNGASDAHLFVDGDARRYLYYKSESKPSSIWVQSLDDGAAVPVLTPTEAWERENVEAPAVTKRGDWYYLFYSGARYCDAGYAIGVARSRSPRGPFVKQRVPLVATGDGWVGPGHPTVTGELLGFHAYRASEGEPSCEGHGNRRRHVVVERVSYDSGWPRIVDVPRS